VAGNAADWRARLNLVLSLAAANRPAEAIQVLQPLSEVSLPEADVLGLLGELFRANNQPEQAIAAFRRGIDLYPEEERLYIGLAALCSYYSSVDLALEIVEIGLRNLPASSRLYAMHGVLQSQIGQRDKAAADFERASDLSPGERIGRTGLALALLREGRFDDLIREAREQLKKQPQDAASLFMLAQALLRKGAQRGDPAWTEARAALHTAIQISPQFDQARALLGKLYLDLGESAVAIRELEAALRIKPDNRVGIYQLMLAYEAAGRDTDSARMQERLRDVIEKERQDDLRRSRIRLIKIPDER
jgi:tetratricopeptide (TPR) repeat protein